MPSIEQTGRTVEDAVKSALKILGVSREDVQVEVLSQESRGLLGILGYTEAKVRVTTADAAPTPEPEFLGEDSPVDEPAPAPAQERPEPQVLAEPTALALRAQDLLTQILGLMNLTARVEITREDTEAIYLTIRDEEDLGLLIGKRGQTLASLQVVTAMISNHPYPLEERKRIILDAADYRARRERALVAMARSAAERATRTGREVPLQPLPPRERRVIHVSLADDSSVATRSEGEEPERFVVIVPKRRREPDRDRGRGGRRRY